MPTEEYYDRVATLQQQLGEAKDKGDTETEVDTLIEIGRLAASEGDYGLANMHFNLASRVIHNTKTSLERLHEVLGELGLILRRAKRYQESLDLYKQAAEAAQEHAGPLERALWVGKQGGIHRLMGEADLARDAFERSRELYSKLGKEGIAGVAEQEGNLGLLAHDRGDEVATEKAYRRAVDLAVSVGADDPINLWGTNLGNTLSRRRLYHEAWTCYEKAMDAAIHINDDSWIRNTAVQWGTSYRNAHRLREAGEVLLKAAQQVSHWAFKSDLLESAMADLAVAGEWQRVLDIGSELRGLLEKQATDQAPLDRCNSVVNTAKERLSRKHRGRAPGKGESTALDVFIPSSMAKHEESKNFLGMRDVAHLICDVKLGLMNPKEEAWKPLLSETCLGLRVLGEAMKALCEAGLPEQSLELSQRFKSLGFCLPRIQRVREKGAPNKEAVTYLANLDTLSKAVSALKGPASENGQQRVEAVRAAGEALLESGEILRNRDQILHARLGGVIRPHDLIGALPVNSPVAIVDLCVSSDATILHILMRRGNDVQVIPVLVSSFTSVDTEYLLTKWAECNITHELSKRQAQGLLEISQVLHDRLFCELAKKLSEWKITQIILIPDVFTRHLPLHLARVCAEKASEIVEHINVPDISTADVEFLCDAFPIEYVPCLQAVMVSQYQKRPRAISRVVSLADPGSDLPGQRNTADWLGSRLPKSLKYTSYAGKQATLKNLSAGIEEADVVVIGTHGYFDNSNPNESFLQFRDGHWTMADMLDRPSFTKRPMVVLSACEVGAAAPTPNDVAASGIPGALISAGAACILASLWPVEDISMGYVVERFITHLSHPGYRPAAALFRAIFDLRRLTKRAALERCYGLSEEMVKTGAADRLPGQFLMLNQLIEWIEDFEGQCPFVHPQVWGGIVIVGSGWHSQAGALAIAAEDVLATALDHRKRQEARELMGKGRFNKARVMLEEILPYADGVERARTLEALAWAVWGSQQKRSKRTAAKEANNLLEQAEFLAMAEEDEQILRDIRATRQKIALG